MHISKKKNNRTIVLTILMSYFCSGTFDEHEIQAILDSPYIFRRYVLLSNSVYRVSCFLKHKGRQVRNNSCDYNR